MNFLFLSLLFISNLFGLVQLEKNGASLKLSTPYGTETISEPVLIALIQSEPFERLKYINQYGVVHYMEKQPKFTRYEHSLGVFFLTRKYGAPLEEQIAALLHDVSHTVFSHVGDIFFKSNYRTGKESYQDAIHESYLEKVGITGILQTYGYDNACSSKAKQHQRCYDQNLPNLCADRIEYNLTGGLIDDLLTENEITCILSKLHFQNGEWFFDDLHAAKKFCLLSIQLSENRWGGVQNAFLDHNAAQALHRACELKLITHDDIHFSTDDIVWKRFLSAHDAHLDRYIKCILYPQEHYCLCNPEEKDLHLKGKFSGTDPLVNTDVGLQHLTKIDPVYKQEFTRVKTLIEQGWYIKVC